MMKITYTKPDDKSELKIGFLKALPVPIDENNAPIMTETAWIVLAGQNFY